MKPFRSRKHHIDGHKLDSSAELKRYGELKFMELAKEIEDLRVHQKHPLVVNGEHIGTYTPDFEYFQVGRGVVYEDVKGIMTPDASLRIRLFQAIFKTTVVLISKKPMRVRASVKAGKIRGRAA